jgi:Fe-Mn family superoxide dismutase
MDLKKVAREAIRESLEKSGKLPQKQTKKVHKPTENKPLAEGVSSDEPVLKEALVVTPQSFLLKTEKLSDPTKRAHERLYNGYVEKFNRTSSALDADNRQDANGNSSAYRSHKIDETYNLNAIKLHELYFHNISDLASEISVDSIPYMRLARDFGNFENWQFDFMAACRSAREGWAVTVYEPYKNVYMNVIVDSHNVHIPLGTIPVLVMDMWAHSYYRDYQDSKDDYIAAMMREINWNVVEARMALADRAELNGLYFIKPVYNAVPEEMLQKSQEHQPPIDQVSAPGQIEEPVTQPQELPPNTPQAASPQYPRYQKPGGGY